MFDKIKYDNEYIKNNYDTYQMTFKKGKKAELQKIATNSKIKLSELIKLALNEYFENHDIDFKL